ncbi:mucin-19-like [Littorina saxatilis]|uniref:Uncharacterized protein n=1 Tax=Littorina saxatilis TaxID=31220 RepID=A0AAN9GDA5_9CAEN
MKEVSSASDIRLLPSYHLQPNYYHDHRLNKKPGDGEEVLRHLPCMRGAKEINLLANSLTSRLRKAARQRAHASSTDTVTTATTTTTSSTGASRSAPQSGSERKTSRSSSKRESIRSQPQPRTLSQRRPSILKRSLSKDELEKQQKYLLEHSPRADSRHNDLRLPNLVGGRRFSSGPAEDFDIEVESRNSQLLDASSPVLAFVRGGSGGTRIGGGGGGVGGGGGGSYKRNHSSDGHVMWVKRAGIFQPADKYAPGRQTLHGDDQPFSRSMPVDYETLTLASRPDSPESIGETSSWSSGKTYSRKKGLKVSWKDPRSASEVGPHLEETIASASSMRLRSAAGTVQGEANSAYTKPKFNPGKSKVPVIGVKWKVPTPKLGKPTLGGSTSSSEASSNPSISSGISSPTSAQLLPSSSLQSPSSPGKANAHTRDPRHPWRALYPRDVHPVTTAMEREGTSVSKTKWHVPGLRKVPPFTFIEDLMESRCHQWNPAVQRAARQPTRATLDTQSLAVRMAEGGGLGSSSEATTSTANTGCLSDITGQDGEGEFGFFYQS